MLYLNLLRKESDLTSAVVNGQPYPVSQIQSQGGITSYHYSKNGIEDANGNGNAFSQPFSSMGVSAGVSFTFGKDGKKKKK